MIELLIALISGVPQTIAIAVSSFVIGALLAVPLAAGRRSKIAPLRWISVTVIETMRAIPPIVLLFIIYYGLGSGLIRLSTFESAALGLGLYAAAHLAEIYRTGLGAVDRGQWEAVGALGIPAFVAMRKVILPQALIVVIPPAAAFSIALLKDSSIASVIGATDITFRAVQQTHMDLNGLLNFGMAGLLYILLSIPVAWVARSADRVLTRKLTGVTL